MSPNKNKLHSFVFETVSSCNVKSQNISLVDFSHLLGVGKLSIGLQMEDLTPPWTAEATKERG